MNSPHAATDDARRAHNIKLSAAERVLLAWSGVVLAAAAWNKANATTSVQMLLAPDRLSGAASEAQSFSGDRRVGFVVSQPDALLTLDVIRSLDVTLFNDGSEVDSGVTLPSAVRPYALLCFEGDVLQFVES